MSVVKEFFLFRRMLTPALIQIVFWLGILAFIVSGIATMVMHKQFILGLQLLIIGPLVVRVFCELVMVFFRMNANLREIKQLLSRK